MKTAYLLPLDAGRKLNSHKTLEDFLDAFERFMHTQLCPWGKLFPPSPTKMKNLNPFLASVLILYPLKTPEPKAFSCRFV